MPFSRGNPSVFGKVVPSLSLETSRAMPMGPHSAQPHTDTGHTAGHGSSGSAAGSALATAQGAQLGTARRARLLNLIAYCR